METQQTNWLSNTIGSLGLTHNFFFFFFFFFEKHNTQPGQEFQISTFNFQLSTFNYTMVKINIGKNGQARIHHHERPNVSFGQQMNPLGNNPHNFRPSQVESPTVPIGIEIN